MTPETATAGPGAARRRAAASAALETTAAPPARSRAVSLSALRVTLGRTPLWLLTASFTALMALVLTLPWLQHFQASFDHRYEPGSLLDVWSETVRFDMRLADAALARGAGAAAAGMALLAMMVGVFTAGGWLQVFLEHTHGHSVRRFFFGGARYFFRFFRLLLLTLLSLHLIGYLLYGAPWKLLVEGMLLGVQAGELETLTSELTVRQLAFVQDGLYVALAALVLAWGDYTRTRLAMHDTASAVWAGLCSWFLILAHPIRVLRPLAALWLAEVAVLALAVFATGRLGASVDGWGPVLGLFLVGLLVFLWRSVVRGARYCAAVQVSSQLVRPLARPDPWKQSLGGPGGPRYPIGGDEYGVSL